jgi:malate/lactate dehydrogenase
MLSTASALIEATQQAVLDDEQMEIASFITHERQNLSQDDFAKAMFIYSTAIASAAVDKVTKILLTESQMLELCATIDELETMRNEVLSGE